MTTHYRDMDRAKLIELAAGIAICSNVTPLLFYGVDNGNEGSGLRTSNIGCLYTDLRLLEGRHVVNYRLAWITDASEDQLELGDSVSFGLAVAMYQELLKLITNAHPSSSDIKQTLLNLDI